MTHFSNTSIYLHTSESVSAGHPDKVCDQISDALLDYFLMQNPFAHVAVEALATTNRVIIAGEIKGASINTPQIENVIRRTIETIGYDQPGFSYKNVIIENYLHSQSEDIAIGVGDAKHGDVGAGDQGLMFGYACNETEAFMPAPLYYAHKLLRNLHEEREGALKDRLGPDAKSQITIKYRDRIPLCVEAVVLSTQHHEELTTDEVYDMIIPVIEKTFAGKWAETLGQVYINPTGRFVIGGPDGDTGLTGRKIIVDTYGGAAPHGGGAFSGKDPTKVDRSAAYMMRYLAKNIVAAGLCDRCTLQVSYVIGKADPLSFYINTHNSGRVPQHHIQDFIHKNFDLTPRGIRHFLKLNKPMYLSTASYGHFGRTPKENGCFSWEKLNSVDLFKVLL
ncbi:MAG: methionine adenosyltransferase [Alphaproteobacteria bacterium]|nr:methionine adenosyltransferase [Alphaproteobacteria bacterium]